MERPDPGGLSWERVCSLGDTGDVWDIFGCLQRVLLAWSGWGPGMPLSTRSVQDARQRGVRPGFPRALGGTCYRENSQLPPSCIRDAEAPSPGPWGRSFAPMSAPTPRPVMLAPGVQGGGERLVWPGSGSGIATFCISGKNPVGLWKELVMFAKEGRLAFKSTGSSWKPRERAWPELPRGRGFCRPPRASPLQNQPQGPAPCPSPQT